MNSCLRYEIVLFLRNLALLTSWKLLKIELRQLTWVVVSDVIYLDYSKLKPLIQCHIIGLLKS